MKYMAVYRQIQTAFWQDDFVLQLTPEEKYFYLYLLTNSKTKQCGIYQLPRPIIIIETGYNQETVEKLLNRFIDYGKIIYSPMTKEIGIVNWPKYNPMESPKIKACVVKELKEVKDKTLIMKVYGRAEIFLTENSSRYRMEGVSQEAEEKEKEKEKEKAEEEAGEKEEQRVREVSPTAAAAGELFEEGNKNTPPTSGGTLPINRDRLFDKQDLGDNNSASISISREGILVKGEFRNDDYGDYQCSSIQMQAELLIIRLWNRQKPSPEEVRIAAGYILKFSYSEVETAFTEAVKYDRKKLAYVETVCKKRKERADFAKKKEQERQKRLEQEKKLEEQKKSGVGLGLIAKVFGEKRKNQPE
jgi:hypothetical protein